MSAILLISSRISIIIIIKLLINDLEDAQHAHAVYENECDDDETKKRKINVQLAMCVK